MTGAANGCAEPSSGDASIRGAGDISCIGDSDIQGAGMSAVGNRTASPTDPSRGTTVVLAPRSCTPPTPASRRAVICGCDARPAKPRPCCAPTCRPCATCSLPTAEAIHVADASPSGLVDECARTAVGAQMAACCGPVANVDTRQAGGRTTSCGGTCSADGCTDDGGTAGGDRTGAAAGGCSAVMVVVDGMGRSGAFVGERALSDTRPLVSGRPAFAVLVDAAGLEATSTMPRPGDHVRT